MGNTLTIKMANYIRFLADAKDLESTGGFYRGVAIASLVGQRDDNGMSVYLDTRSPKALTFEGAAQFIEDLKALPYKSSKEDFAAAKAAERKAAKPEPKPEPKAVEAKPAKAPAKKAPAKAKDPKKPMASEGFVNGKATVGSRKGIVLPDVPAAGRTYEVLGAAFKVAAKADALGRIRLSVV